jgi:hypothetical protein
MPANNQPIYSKAPDIQGAGAIIGPTANTAQDGTGAATYSVFQADTTNGGFVQRIRFKAVGSPATTVARVFIHTASGGFTPGTTNTVANMQMIAEITLPTITLSQVAASPDYDVLLGIGVPAGFRVCVTFGTSTGAAGTGYMVTGLGGKY